MTNALDSIIDSIKTPREKRLWKWQKAFAQGHLVGYKSLDPKRNRSKIYREPRIASIAWDSGFAAGVKLREEEEDKRNKK